jgi:hypothetical protein
VVGDGSAVNGCAATQGSVADNDDLRRPAMRPQNTVINEILEIVALAPGCHVKYVAQFLPDVTLREIKAKGKNCYVVSDQSDLPKSELTERWKRVTQLH